MPKVFFVAFGLTFSSDPLNLLDPFRECIHTQEAVGERYRDFITTQLVANTILIKQIEFTHGLYGFSLEAEVCDISDLEFLHWKAEVREYRAAIKALTEFEDIRITDHEIRDEYRKYMQAVLRIRSRERILQQISQRGSKENSLRILLEVFLHLDTSSYHLKRVRRKGSKVIQYHLFVKPHAADRLGLPVNSGYQPIDDIIAMVNEVIVDVDFWTLKPHF